MLSIFNQPYPNYNTINKLPKNSLLICVAVFLFLFLFRPFGVNPAEHKMHYVFICLIHAVNAAIVYLVFFFLLNKFAGAWAQEEKWKVNKAIVITSVLFFLIGLGSFLVRDIIYTNPDNFSWKYFVAETINTFLAGTLVSAGFILFDFYRLVKTNQKNAATTEHQIEETKAIKSPPEILSISVENDSFDIDLTTFLFAMAEGNYTIFYFYKDEIITKQLKRISLKNVEEQFAGISTAVIRTHRSFLVNPHHIEKITGNAQGYQLYFPKIGFAVPVSRAQLNNFKAVIQPK